MKNYQEEESSVEFEMQGIYLLKLIKTEPGCELSASRKHFLGRPCTLRCQQRLDRLGEMPHERLLTGKAAGAAGRADPSRKRDNC